MIRSGDNFILDKRDVESAVMQFICACHPDVAKGHLISVYNHLGCVAIAYKTKNAPQVIIEASKQLSKYQATVLITLDGEKTEQKLYFLEFPENTIIKGNPTIEKMVREAFLKRMEPMIKACATDELKESMRKTVMEAELLNIELQE